MPGFGSLEEEMGVNGPAPGTMIDRPNPWYARLWRWVMRRPAPTCPQCGSDKLGLIRVFKPASAELHWEPICYQCAQINDVGMQLDAQHAGRCGVQPASPGYLPCHRERGHEGPCAHHLADVQGEQEWWASIHAADAEMRELEATLNQPLEAPRRQPPPDRVRRSN